VLKDLVGLDGVVARCGEAPAGEVSVVSIGRVGHLAVQHGDLHRRVRGELAEPPPLKRGLAGSRDASDGHSGQVGQREQNRFPLVVNPDVEEPVGQRSSVWSDGPRGGEWVLQETSEAEQAGSVLADLDPDATPGVGQVAGHLGHLVEADTGKRLHVASEAVGGGVEGGPRVAHDRG
jgi:hypothetical protein